MHVTLPTPSTSHSRCGSVTYLRFLRTPWFVVGVILSVCLLGLWLSRRTRWSPGPAEPVDQARPAGEIYRAGWRIYRRHWQLFLGIGLVFLPIAVIAAILQSLLFGYTGIGHVESISTDDAVVSGLIALGLAKI